MIKSVFSFLIVFAFSPAAYAQHYASPTYNSVTLVAPLGVSSGGTGAANAAGSRTSLGLGNAATANFGTAAGTVADGGALTSETIRAQSAESAAQSTANSALKSANNLSDLPNVSSARTNLGLGSAATDNFGIVAGTIAQGNDSRIMGALQGTNNLSDLQNGASARGNLGLGNAATANFGTAAGTIAQGNDGRITGALQGVNNLSDIASPSTAQINLGLGSIATQSAASVAITGGTANFSTLGGITPGVVTATTLNATSGSATLNVGSTANLATTLTQYLTTGKNATAVNITTPGNGTRIFYSNAGMTGTSSTQTALNYFSVFSDNANCSGQCQAVEVNHNMSSGMTGPRNSVQIFSNFQAASGNTSDTQAEYTALSPQMFINSSDNGTQPAPGYSQGNFFAFNPEVNAGASAKNLTGVYNSEFDVFSSVGATYQQATGILVENGLTTTGNDNLDSAITFGGHPGNAGWNYYISFGNKGNNNSIRTGGTLIGGINASLQDAIGSPVQHVTAMPAYGIDLSTFHITTAAFLSEGIDLSNSTAQVGAAVLTSSPTQTSLDVPDYSSTGATVTNGGTQSSTYPSYIGDTLWVGSCGGEFTVTAVSSGSVTAVSQVTPCVMTTQSTANLAATGGSGRGILLQMTWNTTAQRALVLAPSGVAISLGGSLVGAGTASSVTAGTGAGTSPTIAVSGHTLDGLVTLIEGTSPVASVVIGTVTLGSTFPGNAVCSLTPYSQTAAALTGSSSVYLSSTTLSFSINSGSTALTAGSVYKWAYECAG